MTFPLVGGFQSRWTIFPETTSICKSRGGGGGVGGVGVGGGEGGGWGGGGGEAVGDRKEKA